MLYILVQQARRHVREGQLPVFDLPEFLEHGVKEVGRFGVPGFNRCRLVGVESISELDDVLVDLVSYPIIMEALLLLNFGGDELTSAQAQQLGRDLHRPEGVERVRVLPREDDDLLLVTGGRLYRKVMDNSCLSHVFKYLTPKSSNSQREGVMAQDS